MMRTLTACVLVLAGAAACGKGGKSAGSGSGSSAVAAGSGSGSGSGSAKAAATPADAAVAVAPVAPPAPVCFPADFAGRIDALAADDHSVTICGVNDQKATKCIAIELGSGTPRDAPHPPPPPAPPAGGYTVTDDATTVAVCKGSTCTKLQQLKPLAAPEDGVPVPPRRITVSPDGTIAVAPLPQTDKGPNGLGMFDTASGRRMKVLEVGADDYHCPEPAIFLGNDVIYTTANVCAGPGARATLYKLDGTLIASLAADYNVENGVPVHLDGDNWAVPTLGGGQVLVFDAKSGRALRGIDKIGDAFHPCDDCRPFGPGAMWVSPLTRTPSGKLVVASEAGGIWVIDPASGKIEKAWAFPVCPPAPAAPPAPTP